METNDDRLGPDGVGVSRPTPGGVGVTVLEVSSEPKDLRSSRVPIPIPPWNGRLPSTCKCGCEAGSLSFAFGASS